MGKHPSRLLRYSLTLKRYIDPIEKDLHGDLRTLLSTSFAADIVGHDKATMTYGLYSGGTSTRQKFDAVKSIEYKK